ncbi:hypothetical protein TRP8649_02657 [Pelagimonas phthalicica]|uniref:Uncharacterized protein n=1 Tax=Pelagimonas phthalicica TaxID=1037362 RepID=A0A238JEZ1_9RHOB|nr:hypothetical protein CLV87_2658 [Pelagimonas phthalicica]SMX28532.1 hypothetical protein TRP8649_02657 [Pelagimonas phthalicica]
MSSENYIMIALLGAVVGAIVVWLQRSKRNESGKGR